MKRTNPIVELYSYRYVLEQLIRQQLVLRYRRTFFGYLWTLINPLLTMSITAIVFSALFKMDLKTYVVYLFSGLMAWNFFSAVIIQSSGVFVANESLIKKIFIPKIIFPLSQSIGILIDSLLSFIAIYAIIYFINPVISWSILFIPAAYLILYIFSFGIALLVSVATIFYRDLQHVVTVLMQAWFFLTPVMYKVGGLSLEASFLIKLNPIMPFIELFRAPLFLNQIPEAGTLATCCIYSAVSVTLGVSVFSRYKNLIIYRL
ncbi:ABC transporter permease [Polynucleobacter paneuropaeus]|uniref:ABC transporter permease n=1 Tax=Polynucleobacter paneuropaeus TaxID=2527775 RepID=UPI001BFE00C0|nr:ABC transporter permease [Polynucleobacter paneuropaeus]QWD49716.1 ABC transporter permease [Polynucleobacter paneuropaeus]